MTGVSQHACLCILYVPEQAHLKAFHNIICILDHARLFFHGGINLVIIAELALTFFLG